VSLFGHVATHGILLSTLASSALVLVTACDGASANPGPVEDVQVSGGQFVPGPLPGLPPSDGGAPAQSADGGTVIPPLTVTRLSVPAFSLPVGATGQSVSGYVTDDATSVGVRLADIGTGYWIVPVGNPDPLYPGQITFSMRMNFAPTIPAGSHVLRVVAIGGNYAGIQASANLCFQSHIPDNGHTCNPANVPPAAVISLSWDTNFDLDLHVVAPNGEEFDPKTPYGFYPDSGARPAATLPYIDRDSNASCSADGIRQEDLIFPQAPSPGTYDIYVDPFAPCGQQAVRFTVTVYTLAGTCPACSLQPLAGGSFPQSGELLASQATGGATTGLFVGTQQF
jgi:hypothetical protein